MWRQGAGGGIGGDHGNDAAVVGLEPPVPPIPFGQEDAVVENQVVLRFRGQVEVEPEPGAARPAIAGEGETVHVLCGGAGPFEVVFLVGAAVDLHILAPGEDVLHADGDQALILLRHLDAIAAAAAALAERLHAVVGRGPLLFATACARAARNRGARVQPERDGGRRPSASGQCGHATGLGQGGADRPLALGFAGGNTRRVGAQGEVGGDQAPVAAGAGPGSVRASAGSSIGWPGSSPSPREAGGPPARRATSRDRG